MTVESESKTPVSINLVTKSGQSLTLNIDKEDSIQVELEAGEFFYDISHAIASVKCKNCDSAKQVELEERSCDTEEWGLEDYEDCVVYGSRFECPDCSTELCVHVLATWYNNHVRLSGHRTINCNLTKRKRSGSVHDVAKTPA